MTIGEWPNKKNIESLNLTRKVNIFRLWRGKNILCKKKYLKNIQHLQNVLNTFHNLYCDYWDLITNFCPGSTKWNTPFKTYLIDNCFMAGKTTVWVQSLMPSSETSWTCLWRRVDSELSERFWSEKKAQHNLRWVQISTIAKITPKVKRPLLNASSL